jgi:hypothetical protein
MNQSATLHSACLAVRFLEHYFQVNYQEFSRHLCSLLQEFIRCNPVQSQPLLQAILQTPSLTGLLAPNFNPNSSPPEVFVSMYEDMIQVPSAQAVEVAFALLTKVMKDSLVYASKVALQGNLFIIRG